LLFGCRDGAAGDSSHSPDGSELDAQTADAAAPCAGRGEEIGVGTKRVSDDGAFRVTLLELQPEIPRVGNNNWTLLVERNGAPWNDTPLRVSSWMPDHSHGSLKTPVDYELEQGRHWVTPLSFQMPGLWQVTVAADTDGGTEHVVFSLCVSE
jgi:hypothetical protein